MRIEGLLEDVDVREAPQQERDVSGLSWAHAIFVAVPDGPTLIEQPPYLSPYQVRLDPPPFLRLRPRAVWCLAPNWRQRDIRAVARSISGAARQRRRLHD